MLIICTFALMVILTGNILSELKATERSEKRLRASKSQACINSSAVYDWNKEKGDRPLIISFEALTREKREQKIEKRSSEDIYFLDACANFGEGSVKRGDKIIRFSDIQKA